MVLEYLLSLVLIDKLKSGLEFLMRLKLSRR